MPVNDYYKKISTENSDFSTCGSAYLLPFLDHIDAADLLNHSSETINDQKGAPANNKENLDIDGSCTGYVNDYYKKILDEYPEGPGENALSNKGFGEFHDSISLGDISGNTRDSNHTKDRNDNYSNNNNINSIKVNITTTTTNSISSVNSPRTITSFTQFGAPDVGYSTLCMGPLSTPIVSEKDVVDYRPVSAVDSCPCNVCGKVFQSNVDLVEHLKTHLSDHDKEVPESDQSQNYPFDVCGKTFRDNNAVVEHLRTHLSDPTEKDGTREGSQNYSCSVCGKVFSNNIGILKHLETHLGDLSYDVKFLCKKCGNGYNSQCNLKRHLSLAHQIPVDQMLNYMADAEGNVPELLETGLDDLSDNVRKFLCKICGNYYNHKYNLKRHLFKAHQVPDDQMLNYLADSKSNVPEHLETHLGDISNDVRKFLCKICGNDYHHRYTLKRHLFKDHQVRDDLLLSYVADAESNVPSSRVQSAPAKDVINRPKLGDKMVAISSHSASESTLDVPPISTTAQTSPHSRVIFGDNHNSTSFSVPPFSYKEKKCVCGQYFQNRTKLMNHLYIVHEIGDKFVDSGNGCPFCTDIFYVTSTSSLKEHILKVHRVSVPESVPSSAVSIEPGLSKDLTQSNPIVLEDDISLSLGIKSNSNVDDMNLSSNTISVSTNILSNTASTSYSNDLDNTSNSSTYSNNNSHMTIKSKAETFFCKICEKSLSTKFSLKRHLLKVHFIADNPFKNPTSPEGRTEKITEKNVHIPWNTEERKEEQMNLGSLQADTVKHHSHTETNDLSTSEDYHHNVEDDAMCMLDIHL